MISMIRESISKCLITAFFCVNVGIATSDGGGGI